ncbi:hypothetical protein Mapa_002195 [Marchantia paleacea]|nr:hypothetical protein Mapa_002195 [Marchantia paleacea]
MEIVCCVHLDQVGPNAPLAKVCDSSRGGEWNRKNDVSEVHELDIFHELREEHDAAMLLFNVFEFLRPKPGPAPEVIHAENYRIQTHFPCDGAHVDCRGTEERAELYNNLGPHLVHEPLENRGLCTPSLNSLLPQERSDFRGRKVLKWRSSIEKVVDYKILHFLRRNGSRAVRAEFHEIDRKHAIISFVHIVTMRLMSNLEKIRQEKESQCSHHEGESRRCNQNQQGRSRSLRTPIHDRVLLETRLERWKDGDESPQKHQRSKACCRFTEQEHEHAACGLKFCIVQTGRLRVADQSTRSGH